MARNITLLQLRTDIRWQSDQVGASLRHTDTQLSRAINQSIQRFRARLSNEGSFNYLEPATGTLTVGATSPYSFRVLDLSAVSPSVVRTYGADITVDGVVHSLLHVPFAARNDYGGPNNTAVPIAWAHYQTRKIAILPAPDGAYAYVVWYLPVLADLSVDGDTFDGVAGWEDYIVWDVVQRLIVRDQFPQAYAMAVAFAMDIWKDILNSATRVTNAGGARIGRDTMGQRYIPRNRLPEP